MGGVINGVSSPYKYLSAPQEPSRTDVFLQENVALQALIVHVLDVASKPNFM